MKENKREEAEGREKEHRWLALLTIFLAVLAVIIAVVLVLLFRGYRKTVLDSQKNELLNISESVANSLEVCLEDFQRTAEILVGLDEFCLAEEEFLAGREEAMAVFLAEVVEEREEEIATARYASLPGESTSAGQADAYVLQRSMGSSDVFQETDTVKDEEGRFYFCLSAQTEKGGKLLLFIPMTTVYEKTASYIQMGENGYVMIKDSAGIILMHQAEEQIGLDVLADRKEIYPDLDYSELEVLIAHQLAGETGVEIYRSYWWTMDPPVATRKVSSYLPLSIGDDFLIVSAVMDYSDIIVPVQRVVIIILVITVLLVVLFIFTFLFGRKIITRHMKMEQENAYLRKVNEQLEQLHRQEEMLAHKQRLQLIGTMTSGITHEFNNLLTPIMGYAEMILSGMTKDDENYEDMQEILNSAQKAKEIVDQVTQFSRASAETPFEVMHIGDAVKKALIITEAVMPHDVALVSDVDDEDDLCMGNPLQVRQMVVNLCNNAIQAMQGGGGTLTVSGHKERVSESADRLPLGRQEMCVYRIEVRDTGCGMDKEMTEQIFIPFFTTKKLGEGTGLGLAIVQRLVEDHGGTIRVKSEVGRGTCFTIDLPVLDDGTDAAGRVEGRIKEN